MTSKNRLNSSSRKQHQPAPYYSTKGHKAHLYKYPTNLVPVILPAYITYEDGTVCSAMSSHKNETLGNHPTERIQLRKLLFKFVHQLTHWWLWRCQNTGTYFKFAVTLFLECLPYIGCHNTNLVFPYSGAMTTIYSIAKSLYVALYLHSGTTRYDLCHLQIAY
jgi:hypothetical protein